MKVTWKLIHDFLKETSTETLKLSTCASCTEKVVDGNSTIIPDANINLNLLMQPNKSLCPMNELHIMDSDWLDPDVHAPNIPAPFH